MRALILLLAFCIICGFAALFSASLAKQFKTNVDVQAYQRNSLLEGIDIQPTEPQKY